MAEVKQEPTTPLARAFGARGVQLGRKSIPMIVVKAPYTGRPKGQRTTVVVEVIDPESKAIVEAMDSDDALDVNARFSGKERKKVIVGRSNTNNPLVRITLNLDGMRMKFEDEEWSHQQATEAGALKAGAGANEHGVNDRLRYLIPGALISVHGKAKTWQNDKQVGVSFFEWQTYVCRGLAPEGSFVPIAGVADIEFI